MAPRMISTNRLQIGIWTEDLAEAFHELTQDEGFNAFPITIYRQESVATAKQWIREQRGKFPVVEKETGALIGMGGLTPWTWEGEDLIDITYRLRKSAWGKGYGRELAEALVKYGFGVMNLPQITATITPDNLPSKKMAEKLGMKLDTRIILKGVATDLYRLRRT